MKNGLGRQRRMTTWIKYAAVIALPLLVAGVWLLFPRGGEQSIPVAQNTKIVKREVSPVLEVVGGGKVILEKEKDKMIEAVGVLKFNKVPECWCIRIRLCQSMWIRMC